MKTKTLLKSILIAIMLLASLKPASAQQNKFTPYTLLDLKTVAEAVISPDNKYVAYTLIVPRPLHDGAGSDYRDLYLYDVAKKTSSALYADKKMVHGINWTPDGKRILFKAMSFAQGTQLCSVSPSGSDIQTITNHPGGIMQYEYFNTDLLYYTALAPESEAKSELVKGGFDMEIYEEEYRDILLYELNIKENKTRQITYKHSIFDFAVSPDGKFAVAAVAEKNLTDYSYMFKRIHVIDLQNLKTEKILDNPGKLGKIRWSPDGKKIAFQSASGVNDAVVGSLFVMDFPNTKTFEQLENLVQGFRGSVIDFSWKDKDNLYFAAEEGVDISLCEYNLKTKKRTMIINPGQVVFHSFSANKTSIAFAGNTALHPNEVFIHDLKKSTLNRLTDSNPFLNQIVLAKQEKITYPARDGLELEGVLVYPLHYQAGTKYPLIVYIHGGPEAANQNGWCTNYSSWGQIAASDGFFVFYPNYRASSGRGVEFTMAGYGDLLGKEFDDVLDGIDHLINTGLVDQGKVGIGGGSYGGYFAAWAATRHSPQFAAAVVFVGISNQISKRNITDIPMEDYLVHWGFWSYEHWEEVFEVSPVRYAHESQTPTLILHGKDDPRIPVSQGMELYRALKMHGKAPVRLVLYPGEGHGNRKNTSRFDYIMRTMEWFNYYLNSDQPKDQMPEKYYEIKK